MQTNTSTKKSRSEIELEKPRYMSPMPRDSNSFIEEMQKIDEILDYAKPITGEAIKAHRELVDKMNKYFPGKSIERIVLTSKKLDCLGDTLTKPDTYDMKKIIIHPCVASMNDDKDFKKNQRQITQKITPKEFFQYVLSHQYGHIITDSLDSYLVNESINSGINFTPIYSSSDEAFAIWFSKMITGINQPIEKFKKKNEEFNFKDMKQVYDDLIQFQNIHGIDELFKTKNIVKILYQ